MCASEQEPGEQSTDKREKHVALCVVYITLRAQEIGGAFTKSRCDEPLDDLVDRSTETDHRNAEKSEPAAVHHHLVTQENLASVDEREESLYEMPHLVVVVAAEYADITQPVPYRHLCIGVVSADHEDDRMDRDTREHEVGERETLACEPHDHCTDYRRRNLEHPGEVVVRLDPRPDENDEHDHEQKPFIFFIRVHIFC